MKSSKYNVYYSEGECFYIYNQLTGAFTEVDKDLFVLLKDNSFVDSDFTDQLKKELIKSHYICNKELNEENIVLSANKTFRFSNQTARITILPTLNCNFNCWYCYESHIESQMSVTAMNAVISFCQNIIRHSGIREFHLDWFGGEPLLYFDEVMYPISLSLKEACQKENIRFSHTITTNGYLITEDMIRKFKEIKLNSFQITLDGSKFYHNKTRYSANEKNSYDVILKNIVELCRQIEYIDMTVRINYTPKNIHTLEEIAYDFPVDVRAKIQIQPQLVWQFKTDINEYTDIVKEKMLIFIKNGYKEASLSIPRLCNCCYVENMKQYVINYDLSVYKCTARNFVDKKFSIGKITEEGILKTNSNYYNYYTSSHLENPQCLDCEYLPSCSGMCLQKKIENSLPKCPKDNVAKSLINQLRLLIDKTL